MNSVACRIASALSRFESVSKSEIRYNRLRSGLETLKARAKVARLQSKLLSFVAHFGMLTAAATILVSLAFARSAFGSVGPVADITLVNALVAPDGFTRSAVTAGGTIPGPLIKANVGDTFQLNVIDALTDSTMLLSSSIHWHGFFQANTAWADGPAFVTQCPIAQNDSFVYEFSTVGQPGTYWYHSHLSTQYCDGLRGAMVVYDPNDPHASLYDVDDDSTVITLADWYHAPAHTLPGAPTLVSTLINGLGRYAGGPTSQLSVVSVTQGKRYRYRLVSLSCGPNFKFSIDNHTMTIIEVDGVNTKPLTVDSIQIFAGQRYSFVLNANQTIGSYWIRTVANSGTQGFANGINSAILRYAGADTSADPTTPLVAATNAMVETNLHPLVARPAAGAAVRGGADVNLNLAVGFSGGHFTVNGAQFVPPTAPVLLQILSGAHTAAELLPAGSVYTLPPNSVVELSIPGGSPGAPHPFHLHGHNFWVVRSAGSTAYNYVDPVIRDVVTTGTSTSDNTTIRFETDNAGPWFLHCHIDFHLEVGLAIAFAEDTDTVVNSVQPDKWHTLCPTYNALTPAQLGGL
ncbi:Laccase 1 [Mycena indigotica]|uniref:Laccase 1 n=1 Tax=Mycena indigotica TaxID=2126181 RepID=A0A8H6RXR4_9AGAR|nr:Laccase 1 [Mycena indigotica]KAF7289715.1 Laccase 1 [Mycena indigotica]